MFLFLHMSPLKAHVLLDRRTKARPLVTQMRGSTAKSNWSLRPRTALLIVILRPYETLKKLLKPLERLSDLKLI